MACGRYDAFWEYRLAPWDVAAGILVIREAGGVVTDLDGKPAEVKHSPIVAGNPVMHQWLLSELQRREPGTGNGETKTAGAGKGKGKA